MSNRIEIVSEDLAAELPRCPACGGEPTVYRRNEGFLWHLPRIGICCQRCTTECHGAYCPAGIVWHDSLYLAVSVWTTVAKLTGVRDNTDPEFEPDEADPPIHDQEFLDRQDAWHDGHDDQF